MQLSNPVIITPRLMAGLRIGNGYISIGYDKRQGDDGRTRYQWHIDADGASWEGDDLQSGCCGGTLQQGLESLLAFLTSDGESYRCRLGDDEPSDGYSFGEDVAEWAYQHDEELQYAQFELEDATLIVE